MTILVSGSMAFDHLLKYEGNFKDHIRPNDFESFSPAFLTPRLTKQIGGCAGNICYNLMQLGLKAYPVGTVGKDFKPYKNWLKSIKMPRDFLVKIKTEFTAQAFIISDAFNHQITAFHPGAMALAEHSVISAKKLKLMQVVIGMVSPNSHQAMKKQADEFHQAGIPFIFDPGQGLPMFNQKELRELIEKSTWVIVNHFESKMLVEKSGLKETEIAKKLKALIVTNSEKGSQIYADRIFNVPAVSVPKAVDPTGCGDAYRAGLVYGIVHQLDWEKTARLANVIGAIKVQSQGTQNHQLKKELITQLYQQTYREELKSF